MLLESRIRPHTLIDYLLKKLNIKNDQQLANYFDVAPPVISKIRNFRMEVSANIILLIHEKTDMPVAQIRDLINQSKRQKNEAEKWNDAK